MSAIENLLQRLERTKASLANASADALHVMAQKIGMKRAWFQAQHADFLHYDLVPPRRAAALKLGAVEIPLQAYLRGERIAAPAGELMLPGLDTPPQQSPLARFLDEHA